MAIAKVRGVMRSPRSGGLLAAFVLALFLGLVPAGTVTATSISKGRHKVDGSTVNENGKIYLDGDAVFPITLSWPPPLASDLLEDVVRNGVNVLRAGPPGQPWSDRWIEVVKEWNRKAGQLGAHTWVDLSSLSNIDPGSSDDDLLAHVVTSLVSDPSGSAVAFWKGFDEPTLHHVPPDDLQFAYCRVTGRGDPAWCEGEEPLDGNHLWVTIQTPHAVKTLGAAYSGVTDVHGVDVYPVNYAGYRHHKQPRLHQVGKRTREMLDITPSGAVWTTLQICSQSSHGSGSEGRYVLPTAKQERYMIYDAIINGAKALAFFGGHNPECWDSRSRRAGWNVTFWERTLRNRINEIGARSSIAPVLLHPRSTTIAASDRTTQAVRRMLTRGGKRHLWIIAARSGSKRKKVVLRGLPRGFVKGTVYAEDRSVRIKNRTLTDSFSRWAVHVYHFRRALR